MPKARTDIAGGVPLVFRGLSPSGISCIIRENNEEARHMDRTPHYDSYVKILEEELIPEAQLGEHSHAGTASVMAGFLVMMLLDVLLG